MCVCVCWICIRDVKVQVKTTASATTAHDKLEKTSGKEEKYQEERNGDICIGNGSKRMGKTNNNNNENV